MGFFETAYDGTPPWDIGRPQAAVVGLERSGEIRGSVLDVGCGTGDNALFLAERGHEVLGIDLVARAIELARAKARDRDLEVELRLWDALRVHELGYPFDTALDVGMFHTLPDEDRPTYARSLHAALAPGGRAFVLCWNERNPWGYGPRRVTQMEILGTFDAGWAVRIDEAILETRMEPGAVHAWLARLERVETFPP